MFKAIRVAVGSAAVCAAVIAPATMAVPALADGAAPSYVTFDWQISAGSRSFDAPRTGTLNWQTGNVVMNGQIASGWQAGAQVHETGHLVNLAALEFAGTIRIEP